MAGDAEAEEVEKGDGEGDGDGRAEDGGVRDELVPAAGEVEEGRARGEGREEEREGGEEHDRERAEEALPADRDERRDRVRGHDLLLDDELRGRAATGEQASKQASKQARQHIILSFRPSAGHGGRRTTLGRRE